VIQTRFSVRWFKQDSLPLDVVYKLVEATTRALAHGGEQRFFVIVVSEEKGGEYMSC
jgi:hypothetical protein